MSARPQDTTAVEAKWQARWEAQGAWRAESYPDGPTYFVLVFPPYPNGRIHMGHVRSYTIGDAVARYKRLRGMKVLHPIGFDAFGLPNEVEATKQGLAPERLTRRNIEAMTRQLRRLGFSYDWSRAIVTIDPDYYRWNQWLFLNLLKRGLAYREEARVQWCPSCRTSLANEQVRDGRCWRCATEVVSRHLPQWFFRLRSYADEIWDETESGVYPDNVAAMIRDWLGRTEGAELRFPVPATGDVLPVFTTQPELAHGATYLALSPEHPLAESLAARGGVEEEARRLAARVRRATDPARLTDGVATGIEAIHPMTGEPIPIWLAAYVDPRYATGAAMGNPAHDHSDRAFGRAHGIPGRPLVSAGVRREIVAGWEARGIGARSTVFAIRDWLVSRQRGWGTPIPVVHCPDCGPVAVPEKDLPVRVPPDLRDFGDGNPLAHRPDFLACRCPDCGAGAERETDTMDTFLDTAWYYLRCTNPAFGDGLCDPRAVEHWGQADLYVGGIEIVVPIMLYGSFVTKALRDAGLVDFAVPCRRLLAHDMVLKDGRKMSKSLGNTVDPEELVARVGADALRLLVLSLAPPLKKIEWSDRRLSGCRRFLKRVEALGSRLAARRSAAIAGPETVADRMLRDRTDEVIQFVTRDLERLRPNTCITALINFLYVLARTESDRCEDGTVLSERATFHKAFDTLLILLSPFAPHACEELWEQLGHPTGLCEAHWPDHAPDPAVRAAAPITAQATTGAAKEVRDKPLAIRGVTR